MLCSVGGSATGWRVACLCIALGLAALAGPTQAGPAPAQGPTVASPLPLSKFLSPFGTPRAAISPDGQHVAMIEHQGTRNGVKLVRLADMQQRVLVRGAWAEDGHYRVFRNPQALLWVTSQWLAVDYGVTAEAIDLQGRKVADLGSRLIGKAVPTDPESPLMLVFADDGLQSVAQVDVRTRRMTRLSYPMRGDALEWSFDERGELRTVLLAESSFLREDSSLQQWYRPTGRADWVLLRTSRVDEERMRPLAASAVRDELIVASRLERDRQAILRLDPMRPDEPAAVVFEHPQQDVTVGETLRGAAPLSFVTLGMKAEQHWLDPGWRQVQKAVDEVLPGRINLLTGNPQGKVLVFSYGDVDPGRWHVLDVPGETLQWLASGREAIDPGQMRPMQTLRYSAPDGLSIPAYLTLPAHTPAPGEGSPGKAPLHPTVVLVHGGPAARDHWSWDAEVQLLASRGFAVWQPQFRGSTGFGRAFEQAGHGQWGRAMQADITAGVKHLVDQGIADPRRICIVGASYGGYAAVWGLVDTPELYRCAVTLNGVADIGYMLSDSSDANDDKLTRELLRRTVGDLKRDQALFDAVSPLLHAQRIRAPLLIVHAEEDLRVPQSHARRLMSALKAADKPFEWLPLPGEGHTLAFLASQHRYYERLLDFLQRHIGPAADRPKP